MRWPAASISPSNVDKSVAMNGPRVDSFAVIIMYFILIALQNNTMQSHIKLHITSWETSILQCVSTPWVVVTLVGEHHLVDASSSNNKYFL
jgi:hypothetical protein